MSFSHSKALRFLPLFFVFILFSCGSNTGTDPHLSQEEVIEITEINLVGKWKIRRPSSSSKQSEQAKQFYADCTINEIEFFEDGSYLFHVSTAEAQKIYRGNYGIDYIEENDEYTIHRIVLMESTFEASSAIPTQGSIATLTEIDLSSTNIAFNATLGSETSAFCSTGTPIELSGEKAEEIAPEADENSNHFKITKEWRLFEVSAEIEGQTDPDGTSQNICNFLEQEREDRCSENEGESSTDDCPYASSLTLIMSEYGTYLFTYYDAEGNPLTEELGDWRWRTDSEQAYTVFEVKDQDETYAESDTSISVSSLTESTMSLRETLEDTDEEGNTFTIHVDYRFQLASLAFQNLNCSDAN